MTASHTASLTAPIASRQTTPFRVYAVNDHTGVGNLTPVDLFACDAKTFTTLTISELKLRADGYTTVVVPTDGDADKITLQEMTSGVDVSIGDKVVTFNPNADGIVTIIAGPGVCFTGKNVLLAMYGNDMRKRVIKAAVHRGRFETKWVLTPMRAFRATVPKGRVHRVNVSAAGTYSVIISNHRYGSFVGDISLRCAVAPASTTASVTALAAAGYLTNTMWLNSVAIDEISVDIQADVTVKSVSIAQFLTREYVSLAVIQ